MISHLLPPFSIFPDAGHDYICEVGTTKDSDASQAKQHHYFKVELTSFPFPFSLRPLSSISSPLTFFTSAPPQDISTTDDQVASSEHLDEALTFLKKLTQDPVKKPSSSTPSPTRTNEQSPPVTPVRERKRKPSPSNQPDHPSTPTSTKSQFAVPTTPARPFTQV